MYYVHTIDNNSIIITQCYYNYYYFIINNIIIITTAAVTTVVVECRGHGKVCRTRMGRGTRWSARSKSVYDDDGDENGLVAQQPVIVTSPQRHDRNDFFDRRPPRHRRFLAGP